jgi:hypothetical protein
MLATPRFFCKPPNGTVRRGHPLAAALYRQWLLGEGGGSQIYDNILGDWTSISAVGTTGWAMTQRGIGYDFDGTNYFTAISHMATVFTHEVWWVPTTTTTQGIMETDDGAATGSLGASDRTIFTNSSSKVLFQIFDGADNVITGTTTVVSGNLYHIIGTGDGSSISLYVNGLQEATAAAGSAYTGYAPPFLSIGRTANNVAGVLPTPTDGIILLARTWAGRSLNAAEVQSLYMDPFGLQSPGYTPYVSFSGSSVVTVPSVSTWLFQAPDVRDVNRLVGY